MENLLTKDTLRIMKQTLIFILNLWAIMAVTSCSNHEDALPVSRKIRFSYTIEPMAGIRSTTGKDYFYNGDRIYISATFTLNEGGTTQQTEVVTVSEGTIPTTIVWPEDATNGIFTAWFAGNELPDENTGILTTDMRSDILKATTQEVTPEKDIILDFKHELIRIIITGIQKDETLTVSSASGSDGVVSFDTNNLLSGNSPLTSGNSISLTLTASDNTFYLQQWTQSLTIQSDKGAQEQTVTCPSDIAAGKSYTILFRP